MSPAGNHHERGNNEDPDDEQRKAASHVERGRDEQAQPESKDPARHQHVLQESDDMTVCRQLRR